MFPYLLDHRYTLLETAGSGAAGKVYRAHDRWRNDCEVAVKLYNNRTNANWQALLSEFSLFAPIRHPSFTHLYSIGIDESNKSPYLAMEWIEGESPDSYDWKQNSTEILRFVVEILRSLHFLHANNIVHHDLKPGNLKVFNRNGQLAIKLLDFGLAGRTKNRSRLRGTWDYLPPERWGEKIALPGIDLYSVGIILFQIVTGHTPYSELSPAQAVRKRGEAPLPDVRGEAPWAEAWLVDFISRLTDPNPANRLTSARQALHYLSENAQQSFPYETTESFQNYFCTKISLPAMPGILDSNYKLESRKTSDVIRIDPNLLPEDQIICAMIPLLTKGIPAASIDDLLYRDSAVREQIKLWLLAKNQSGKKPILLWSHRSDYKVDFSYDIPDAHVVHVLVTDYSVADNHEPGGESVVRNVPPRNRRETEQYVRQLFPALVSPDSWFDWLQLTSAGYDHFLRKRISETFSEGWFVPTLEGWAVQRTEMPSVLPVDLTNLYREWIGRVPKEILELAGRIALFPHGIPKELLQEASGIDWSTIEAAPTVHRLLQIDDEEDGVVLFYPPAVRKMVEYTVDPEKIDAIYHWLCTTGQSSDNLVWRISAIVHLAAPRLDFSMVESALSKWQQLKTPDPLDDDTFARLLRLRDDPDCPLQLRGRISALWGKQLATTGAVPAALAVLLETWQERSYVLEDRLSAANSYAMLLLQKGQFDTAEPVFSEVVREAPPAMRELQVVAHAGLAWIATVRQNWDDAANYAGEALALCNPKEMTHDRLRALNVKAMINYHVRHALDDAEKNWTECLKIARHVKIRRSECDTLNNLGVIAAVRGHNRQAIRYWHQALKIGRDIGYSARLSAVQVNIGVKYFESGKLQDAEISYLQGLDFLRRAEKITDQVFCLGNLSELQLCHANYRASFYYNTSARDLVAKVDSLELQFQPLLQLAELHYRTGNLDAAYDTLLTAERLSPDPSDIDRLRIASMKYACRPDSEPAIDLEEVLAQDDWERIDQATLILWWLQSHEQYDSAEFIRLSSRLLAIGTEAQHLWIETWGKYYSLVAATKTTTPSDWENTIRSVTQFPEIHWRVLWKAGNAWKSAGEFVSARNSFRKAIQILKQITSQLHSGEAATYLKASDPSRFRIDMTTQ